MFPGIRTVLLALTLSGLAGTAVQAQDAQIAFKGLRSGAGKPVEVVADLLEVSEKDNEARFRGHVIVTQGEMKLSSDDLLVTYTKADKTTIDSLHATGNVLMSTPAEAAKGAEATYQPNSGNLTMTGDVLLTQGQSVMTGSKLIVDLNTGKGRMEGRVKTLLQTGTTTP